MRDISIIMHKQIKELNMILTERAIEIRNSIVENEIKMNVVSSILEENILITFEVEDIENDIIVFIDLYCEDGSFKKKYTSQMTVQNDCLYNTGFGMYMYKYGESIAIESDLHIFFTDYISFLIEKLTERFIKEAQKEYSLALA